MNKTQYIAVMTEIDGQPELQEVVPVPAGWTEVEVLDWWVENRAGDDVVADEDDADEAFYWEAVQVITGPAPR